MLKPRAPRYADIFRGDSAKEEVAKQVWRETIDWLVAQGLLTPRLIGTVDRYARAYAEYESLYPEISVEGPVKAGPNGDFVNLKWAMLEKLNERIGKLEDALLISAKAAGGRLKEKPADGPKAAADEFLDARPN